MAKYRDRLVMPNKELLIHFQDFDAHQISWVMRENDKALDQPQLGTLADIPATNSYSEIIVYVPTESIIMLKVTLPNMPAAQRAQAALYALEEQLVEDVHDLHAVVWEDHDDNQYYVAAIRKSLLQDWLNKLHAVNIFPTKIFPDIVTIPLNDGEWTVASHGAMIHVKTDSDMGFAIESDYVQSILQEILLTQKIRPTQIVVYDNKETIVSLLFNDLDIPIKTIIETDQINSRYFWINFNYEGVNCNLLQGEMVRQESLVEKYKFWRTPIILAGIFLGLTFCTTLVKWVYLSHEDTVLQQQISSIYMQLFPDATTVVNPRARIEQLLASSSQSQQGSDFFNLLAVSGQVITAIPQVRLQNISYTAKQLIIQVQVQNAASLTKLNDLFKKYPIHVEQGDTTSSGATISAKFYITRHAS